MIIMVTVWYPPHKALEVGNKFFKLASKKLPSIIKKWEVYGTMDGLNGFKGYHLIKTERENAEEAITAINKLFAPMYTIEGFTSGVEILIGMKDSAEFMKEIK